MNWKRPAAGGEWKSTPVNAKSCHKTNAITLNDVIIDKCHRFHERWRHIAQCHAKTVVDDFVFLGTNVPSVVADVKRRTRLAAWAFDRLKNAIWTNQDITRSLKVRIYRALILPIAIYGAESWTLCQADKRQLNTFEMRCLRVILGVSLMDKIRNEEIRQRLHLPTTICDEVSKRRLKWFGHVVRMPPHRLPFQAYKMTFSKEDHQDAHQPAGEVKLKGTWAFLDPLKEAEHQAQGRPEWRRITRIGEQRDTPS